LLHEVERARNDVAVGGDDKAGRGPVGQQRVLHGIEPADRANLHHRFRDAFGGVAKSRFFLRDDRVISRGHVDVEDNTNSDECTNIMVIHVESNTPKAFNSKAQGRSPRRPHPGIVFEYAGYPAGVKQIAFHGINKLRFDEMCNAVGAFQIIVAGFPRVCHVVSTLCFGM
jgi:hypothetical protein